MAESEAPEAPATPPSSPEEGAAPVTAPLVRRWRDLDAFLDHQAELRETRLKRQKQRRVFAILAGMAALLGAFVGLLFWLHPIAGSYFVPLWITEYESRSLPVNAQADPDRTALRNGGYFPRIDENAFASQEKHLLVQELAALKDVRRGPVVVYLCAFACRAEGGAVSVLPADARASQPSSRLPLRDVLRLFSECPIEQKLLVLDIMRPMALARMGVLEDEAATYVHAEIEEALARLKKEGRDARRLGRILCAASPGQVSLTSEDLGRSIFGFYFEEALRGWGAGYNNRGIRNNRVTVEDLGNFVRVRVDRWAIRNRATRQTPVLLGDGPDFALTALEHGQPQEHLAAGEIPTYPKWLLEGWKSCDARSADPERRADPRLLRQLKATMLRAEQEWRGGIDATRIQNDLKARLTEFATRDAAVKALIPRPPPRSLALAVAQGAKPDLALAADLKALLLAVEQQHKEMKPEDAAKARTKAVQDLLTKYKAKTYFDFAWGVVDTISSEAEPTAEKVLLLDGILLQRSQAPIYIETNFLRRLSGLAGPTPNESTWPRKTVRAALEVVRKGERAMTDPEVYPWVRGQLELAARKRHDAEVLLFSPGYVPPMASDQLLREAREAFDLVVNHEETLRNALGLREQVFDFLPAYVRYLEENPANLKLYGDTGAAAAELDQALTPPTAPLADAELMSRVKGIAVIADRVRARLDDLRWQFGSDRVNGVIAQSRLPEATPGVAQSMEAILWTPFLPAEERAALWKASRELAQRLHEKTRDLDFADDDRGVRTARPPDYDLERGRFEANQHEMALLRGNASLTILRLGGLANDALLPAERALRAAAKVDAAAKPTHEGAAAEASLAPIQRAGLAIRKLWEDRLPAQLAEDTNLLAQARLARIVPALDAVPLIDEPRTNPTVRRWAAESTQLWAWLADFYRYQARDLEGSPFYSDVAIEYQRVAAPPPEAYLQIGGAATVPYLNRFNPSFTDTLRLSLFTNRADANPVRLTVRTADDDWLMVQLNVSQLELLQKPGADFRACSVPMEVSLKQGAELSRTPRPRGFLLESVVDGRTFHRRVNVPALPLPADERVEALLSADPAGPTSPVTNLRLRPLDARQPYYLYVRNTTAKPRNVVVQLKVKDAVVKNGEVKVAVPAGAFRPVNFALPAAPAAAAPAVAAAAAAVAAAAPTPPLPELAGPLRILVYDADRPTDVLDEKVIEAGIASPREYVQVTQARFSPPDPRTGAKNRLEVRVRTLGPLAGPPCRVQLVLPPERIPGLLSARDGNFVGLLPPDGSDLILYANDIKLDEGSSPDGFFHLNVDGLERAFIYACTFNRNGAPTTAREDTQPAIRIRAARFSRSTPKYAVQLEVDNPPPGSMVEAMLTRRAGGAFETDIVQRYPAARSYHLGFSSQSIDGSLQFEALIKDVTLNLNASGVQGQRELRGYLLDRHASEIETAAMMVTFDDSPPDRVRFINAPTKALKGAILALAARGNDDESGITKVTFFVGKAVDGKVPPTVPQVEAKIDPSTGAWAAELPLAGDRRGVTDLSVQFINGVGLSTFASTSINLIDGERKLGPGKIVGTVKEGEIAQGDMEVILELVQDPKAPNKKPPKMTKTKPDGTYEFDDVDPGKYTVSCSKLISGRAATANADVAPEQTVTVDLSLIVK